MTTVERAGARDAIREATHADLLDVFRIEKLVFEQPWPFSAFERVLGAPGFLVRERDQPAGGIESTAIAGYVVADVVDNHGRPLGHIKDLAVHPDAQGQGVGRALVARALAVLAGQGVRSTKLEVRRSNHAAVSLYAEFGFEVLRTVPAYYPDGEDAFVMVTALPDRDAF